MNVTAPAPLSAPVLLLNLVLGIVLSLIIAWYYVRFGQSLSNRTRFAPILPILTLITVLVISVVKSSLALSLGLVGALSIVRFRTAIKDPEELVFLFFAIGIGLGLGADQRIPTLVAVVVIVGYLLLRTRLSLGRVSTHNLYLNIEVNETQKGSVLFAEINQLLLREVPNIDMRRLDSREGTLQVVYYISVSNSEVIASIMDSLKAQLPGSSISLVEQNNLLGG